MIQFAIFFNNDVVDTVKGPDDLPGYFYGVGNVHGLTQYHLADGLSDGGFAVTWMSKEEQRASRVYSRA